MDVARKARTNGISSTERIPIADVDVPDPLESVFEFGVVLVLVLFRFSDSTTILAPSFASTPFWILVLVKSFRAWTNILRSCNVLAQAISDGSPLKLVRLSDEFALFASAGISLVFYGGEIESELDVVSFLSRI